MKKRNLAAGETARKKCKDGNALISPKNGEKENTHICSITGKTFVGYGNNAYPFPGICSDEANHKYVIPARILGVTPEMVSKWGVKTVVKAIENKVEELGWSM